MNSFDRLAAAAPSESLHNDSMTRMKADCPRGDGFDAGSLRETQAAVFQEGDVQVLTRFREFHDPLRAVDLDERFWPRAF
jgi:hypothetical protein